jgi:hypothetical protein
MVWLYQRVIDRLKHGINLCQHIIVPKSQHPKSAFLKESISPRIRWRVSMLPTVDLNDQLPFKTHEVQDEIAIRMLPAKLVTLQLSTPQTPPKLSFGIRHIVSQLALQFGREDGLVGLSLQLTLLRIKPSPPNPPLEGEGYKA